MAAIINTNIASLNAQRNLNTSQSALQTSLQRLSSGLRINSSKDDAAGLAISDRMTAQIRGSQQASRNANDGISLAQTAEGSLNEVANNLQRIRELAIQSANATNSASDRAGLQAEVAQLVSEIDRVASSASFNGVKLLDGTFTSQQFQVGANGTADDRINISAIASARVNTLGSATTNSTTVAGGANSANPLLAGELVLNGVSVQAAVAGAAGQTTDSAFAKAAAINAQSALSFVTATAAATSASGIAAAPTVTAATTASVPAASIVAPAAATTTVAGAAPTQFTAGGNGDIASGFIEINGTAITGAVTGGGDAATQGANVAAAINAQTGTHGVTATANVTTGAITLTNATNASIQVAFTNAAANTANTGLTAGTQAANTYSAITGTNFTVGGTAVTFAGGVYASATLATDGLVTALNTALTGQGYTVANNGGELAISRADGADFTVAVTGAATSAVTGFAVGNTTTTNGVPASSTIAAITSGDLSINGIAITTTIGATTSAAQRGIDLAAAINSQQSTTGVTATAAASGALTLAAADGRNITVAFAGTANATNTGLTAATTRSDLSLSSTNSAGITIAGTVPGNAGFTAGLTASTATTTGGLSLLSIATVAGANAAMATVDAALTTVNTSRADLGAIQNRFSSVVSSLGSTVENLTASRSRIMDTDFAAETASLTRGQILQQAGTAMLAQANQLPNTVLSLLR
jgi:flagellin